MSLKEKISADLKAAMKAGDVLRRDTLRLLDSMFKNAEIEKHKREEGLSDDEVMDVIRRAVKQRQDSIAQFSAGGREEMAAKEKQELEVLQAYLPAQLSTDSVREKVLELKKRLGVESPQDFGKLMGAAMAELKGRADGNVVRAAVEESLKG